MNTSTEKIKLELETQAKNAADLKSHLAAYITSNINNEAERDKFLLLASRCEVLMKSISNETKNLEKI